MARPDSLEKKAEQTADLAANGRWACRLGQAALFAQRRLCAQVWREATYHACPSTLACPPATLPDYMVLISEGQTDVLMEEMDAWLETLPELKSFILPAGSPTVACMHVARTVVRRLERTIVHLMDHQGKDAVRPLALVYVNRLSDWLFVMGRWVSMMLNEEETLWVPLGMRSAEKGVAHRVNQMKANDDDFKAL